MLLLLATLALVTPLVRSKAKGTSSPYKEDAPGVDTNARCYFKMKKSDEGWNCEICVSRNECGYVNGRCLEADSSVLTKAVADGSAVFITESGEERTGNEARKKKARELCLEVRKKHFEEVAKNSKNHDGCKFTQKPRQPGWNCRICAKALRCAYNPETDACTLPVPGEPVPAGLITYENHNKACDKVDADDYFKKAAEQAKQAAAARAKAKAAELEKGPQSAGELAAQKGAEDRAALLREARKKRKQGGDWPRKKNKKKLAEEAVKAGRQNKKQDEL